MSYDSRGVFLVAKFIQFISVKKYLEIVSEYTREPEEGNGVIFL